MDVFPNPGRSLRLNKEGTNVDSRQITKARSISTLAHERKPSSVQTPLRLSPPSFAVLLLHSRQFMNVTYMTIWLIPPQNKILLPACQPRYLLISIDNSTTSASARSTPFDGSGACHVHRSYEQRSSELAIPLISRGCGGLFHLIENYLRLSRTEYNYSRT